MNNRYGDKVGRYPIKNVTLETVDQAVFDYFEKHLAPTVEVERGRNKVPVIFATGERWKLVRDNKGLRDENGTLILPLITLRRTNIDRTRGFGGMTQEVPSITVSKTIHEKAGVLQNLVKARRGLGFVAPKKPVVKEYLTIPFPDFCILFYEISIWTQYQSQMNEILEKIFYSYDHMDSFVMPVDYDGKKKKGDGYYFVGFRQGDVVPRSNVEEFTGQERLLKYSYSIKTPVYLMLDPKDETVAYGRRMGETPDDDGSKVVYKSQNSVDVKLKESIMSFEEFEKLFS